MATTPDPRSLDPTNVIRPLLLIVRPEADGTLTLLLDVPQSDALPLELGGGFRSFDQVLQVVMAALTAPAVAEDRVAGIEEALPTVNQLVDSVNDLTNQVLVLSRRLDEAEQRWQELYHRGALGAREEWGRSAPGGRIPRLGERRPVGQPGQFSDRQGYTRTPPQGQYHDQRAAWDEQFEPLREHLNAQPPGMAPPMPRRAAQPAQEPRSTRETGEKAPGEKRDLSVKEGPRPTFDRGSFEAHQPIGRVSRGPGSPD